MEPLCEEDSSSVDDSDNDSQTALNESNRLNGDEHEDLEMGMTLRGIHKDTSPYCKRRGNRRKTDSRRQQKEQQKKQRDRAASMFSVSSDILKVQGYSSQFRSLLSARLSSRRDSVPNVHIQGTTPTPETKSGFRFQVFKFS
ncbi:unnamed protein product, partial [Mesorhabditis belari]|uniref:Uncharacterized protein n=1 Tax=Mesorhabditis belari TaxID=2138241 RepID=A0AAF3FQN2_9BILA